MGFEQIKKGIVKRTEKRMVGVFIDGTGLDRATRRLNRKVDLAALVRGVASGLPPTVARYYTLIPYEDDYRQHAFLDAVARAGLAVVVKRLPPKGITRQVSVDVEMAADIAAFALGNLRFGELSLYKPEDFNATPELKEATSMLKRGIIKPGRIATSRQAKGPAAEDKEPAAAPAPEENAADAAHPRESDKAPGGEPVKRVVTVVCPGRDLSYPISLARELGADTVTADFGQFNTGDILKSAAKWIDLSDSETIWRD